MYSRCMMLSESINFRGFDEYFSIPYGAENAIGGHWEKGPGIDLFRKVEQALGWKQVIAEDLGYVTDSVRELVRESGFPGMKVLDLHLIPVTQVVRMIIFHITTR